MGLNQSDFDAQVRGAVCSCISNARLGPEAAARPPKFNKEKKLQFADIDTYHHSYFES